MLLSLKFLSLFVKKNPVSWKSNVLFSFKCNPMDRGAWRAKQSMGSQKSATTMDRGAWRAIQSMGSQEPATTDRLNLPTQAKVTIRVIGFTKYSDPLVSWMLQEEKIHPVILAEKIVSYKLIMGHSYMFKSIKDLSVKKSNQFNTNPQQQCCNSEFKRKTCKINLFWMFCHQHLT